MARKKEQAFRTITEVSEWLKTPSHVLRFWESKFTQIKPVKRACQEGRVLSGVPVSFGHQPL